MTTEELVEQLNKNERVTAVIDDDTIYIHNESHYPMVVFGVNDTNFFDLYIDDAEVFDSLGKASRDYVYIQITKYLQTPIEERKAEKKYYLLARSGDSWPYMKARYVTRITTQVDSAAFDYGNKPTVFTEKELSTIKKFDPVLAPAIELMKVPVEDGD